MVGHSIILFIISNIKKNIFFSGLCNTRRCAAGNSHSERNHRILSFTQAASHCAEARGKIDNRKHDFRARARGLCWPPHRKLAPERHKRRREEEAQHSSGDHNAAASSVPRRAHQRPRQRFCLLRRSGSEERGSQRKNHHHLHPPAQQWGFRALWRPLAPLLGRSCLLRRSWNGCRGRKALEWIKNLIICIIKFECKLHCLDLLFVVAAVLRWGGVPLPYYEESFRSFSSLYKLGLRLREQCVDGIAENTSKYDPWFDEEYETETLSEFRLFPATEFRRWVWTRYAFNNSRYQSKASPEIS